MKEITKEIREQIKFDGISAEIWNYTRYAAFGYKIKPGVEPGDKYLLNESVKIADGKTDDKESIRLSNIAFIHIASLVIEGKEYEAWEKLKEYSKIDPLVGKRVASKLRSMGIKIVPFNIRNEIKDYPVNIRKNSEEDIIKIINEWLIQGVVCESIDYIKLYEKLKDSIPYGSKMDAKKLAKEIIRPNGLSDEDVTENMIFFELLLLISESNNSEKIIRKLDNYAEKDEIIGNNAKCLVDSYSKFDSDDERRRIAYTRK